MRLPSQGTAIQSDGDFGPSDFHIEISAHAFAVLSKGLYSDPFRAIVRELACNAWDAHVAAKTTDTPFEIYLPNVLMPVFKIRDFGTGLSEDGMRNVYTSYFTSTKQNSDDMTGCFGLGSKSPYAYTKKFTIVSFWKGTRFHYNAVINERGFPQLMKMGEEETTEPDGLEVSFNVKEEDFSDFQTAAEIALRPFTVQPVVKGCPEFEPLRYPETEVISGQGWRLFSSLDTNIASMGNVEYPIEKTRSGFSSNALKVLSLAIVIEFPLGSFEITPSRESIQWTEFSVQRINERLEQIHDEIVEQVTKKIENATTYWEATVSSWEFLETSGVRRLGITPLWKGRTITRLIALPMDKGFTCTKITALQPRANSKNKNSASICRVNSIDPVATTFFLSDFPGAEYRVSNFVRDTLECAKHVYLIEVKDAAALKEFTNTVGISAKSMVMASSVPKRVRVYKGGNGNNGQVRSRLSGSKARAFAFKPGGSTTDDSWAEAEVDLDEPDLGLYVEINRWSPSDSYFTSCHQVTRSLRILKELGIQLPDGGIIGIKTSHNKEKFADHENWKHLDVWIREQLLAYWNADPDFRVAFRYFRSTENYEKQRIAWIRSLAQVLVKKGLLATTSYLVRFSTTFDRVYNWEAKVENFYSVMDILTAANKNGEQTQGQFSLVMPKPRTYHDKVWTRYPMFEFLRYYGGSKYSGSQKEDLAISEYVSLIDAKSVVELEATKKEAPNAA